MKLRIATRGSQLALWQAEHVKSRLLEVDPSLEIELKIIKTQGDKILDVSLAKIGGKGLFVKEIEQAMMDDEADLAVHSMKDVPAELPEGLILQAILEREDPRDAFVSNKYKSLDELPEGAVVGTSSLRRASQLYRQYPVKTELLRGNVNTRLAKLDDDKYDAIILAAAGLIRLEFGDRIADSLDPDKFIPSPGQGAVGIECREDDAELCALLNKLNHTETSIRVKVEREFNLAIGGSCQVPAGCYATIDGDSFELRAFVASPDGKEYYREDMSGDLKDLPGKGTEIANKLIARGAAEIIKDLLGKDV
ncbi:Prolyl 4-hydroxylase, alpha subunit [Lentisphaera araneosa HTCC2155]|uniref:Porphobilinogen deaminase n=1 Tax=Lentisphaera araneosa HTCC2155 TaxID=313628 RepID=A6DR75_9BACT|nr:hydroxymethylbilane synthase [Lentisphaera araneosa]EDM25822.1 Prolyl 4-hydroxylase, alpha subunit [Lentisphaera araneosa HTCC2155]